MDKASYVYMLASARYGTLYLGVTSDLVKRVWEHREALADGFTKKYGVKQLVWFEIHTDVMSAITREKQLKKWNRAWKIALIQEENPTGGICMRILLHDLRMDSRFRGNDGERTAKNRAKEPACKQSDVLQRCGHRIARMRE